MTAAFMHVRYAIGADRCWQPGPCGRNRDSPESRILNQGGRSMVTSGTRSLAPDYVVEN